MSGLSDEARLALLAAGIVEHPDGSLRSGSGVIVSRGLAETLSARKDRLGGAQSGPVMTGISPDQFHGEYLAAGHAADSPANRRTARPVPLPDPATGGRSTTPPDDGREVEKVVEPERIRRGYLWDGHAAPSPGDLGDNNPHPGGTPGHVVYGTARGDYNANVRQERAGHVAAPHECVSEPAPASWSPSPDLGASNVPQPRAAGATQKAPGE